MLLRGACPSGRVVKPPATVHAGQGSLPVCVEALGHPLRESSLLKARVHAIGLLLDRHRGFTCVLLKCDRWPWPNLERAARPRSAPLVEN